MRCQKLWQKSSDMVGIARSKVCVSLVFFRLHACWLQIGCCCCCCCCCRCCRNSNTSSFPAFDSQDLQQGDVLDEFEAIRNCATEMAQLQGQINAKPLWRSGCERIIQASRRAEQLLQPLLGMEVYPEELAADAASESVAFTYPTAQSHPQRPLKEVLQQ